MRSRPCLTNSTRLRHQQASRPRGAAPRTTGRSRHDTWRSSIQLRVLTNPDLTEDQKDQKFQELAIKSISESSTPKEKAEVEIALYQSLSRQAARAESANNADAARQLKQQATDRLRTAHGIDPTDKAVVDTLFALALDRSQWQEAESLIPEVVKAGLDPANGAFYRGRVYLAQYMAEKKTDVLDKARRELESALTTFPSYSQGHFTYGWALAHLDRPLESAREFSKALELDPGNAQAALGLLLVAGQRTGEDAQADTLRALQICARLMPDNPTVRNLLQARADSTDPVGSIKRREEMRASDRQAGRKDLENLLKLAGLYAKEKQTDRAKELYLEALKTDPREFKRPQDSDLLKLQITYTYATFLRLSRPAEIAEGIKLLDELRQATAQSGTPGAKAKTQIAYAKYLADLVSQKCPGAPELDAVDAEFIKAAELAKEVPSVAMDAAAHFGNTAHQENMDERTTAYRLAQSEKYARIAVSASEAVKNPQDEQNARRVLVEVLIAKRAASKDAAQEKQLDADIRKELAAYKAKGYGDDWELSEESSFLVKTDRLDEALQLLEKYIASQPRDPVAAHLTKAEIYLLRNQRKEAIEELTKVKAKQPDAEKGTYSVRLHLAKIVEGQRPDRTGDRRTRQRPCREQGGARYDTSGSREPDEDLPGPESLGQS